MGLSITDGEGKVRFSVMVSDRGETYLSVKDHAGKTRFMVGQSPSAGETTALDLRDAAGNSRATLSITPDGSPGLSLNDAAGKVRFDATVVEGAPRSGSSTARGRRGPRSVCRGARCRASR